MVVGSLVIVLLLFGVYALRKSSKQKQSSIKQGRASAGQSAGQPRAIPVAVASVQQQDVPVYLEGLGNAQAFYTVTLRTRIDGQLLKVNVREGQPVHKGEELALIDPRPSKVALAQAQATRLKDQSQYENAQRDLARYQDLYKQGVISQQQYNTQQALASQYAGQVRADAAALLCRSHLPPRASHQKRNTMPAE